MSGNKIISKKRQYQKNFPVNKGIQKIIPYRAYPKDSKIMKALTTWGDYPLPIPFIQFI